MQDFSYITLDVSDGWFDILLDVINDNSEKFPQFRKANDKLIAEITKCKNADGTIRIYRNIYEELFYMMLNNHVSHTIKFNDFLKEYSETLSDLCKTKMKLIERTVKNMEEMVKHE